MTHTLIYCLSIMLQFTFMGSFNISSYTLKGHTGMSWCF